MNKKNRTLLWSLSTVGLIACCIYLALSHADDHGETVENNTTQNLKPLATPFSSRDSDAGFQDYVLGSPQPAVKKIARKRAATKLR